MKGIEKEVRSNYNDFSKEWTATMQEGGHAVRRYLERPAMNKMLTDIKGKNVLCIGCGSGEECEKIRKMGARKVVGIDISEKLIENARRSYGKIEFWRMSAQKLKFGANSFDFVYSSLAMHYVPDWKKSLKEINRVMKKGGVFLFSTHHPLAYGSDRITDRQGIGIKRIVGYSKGKDGEFKVYGDYFRRRVIRERWFKGKMKVTFYHRSLEEMVGEILRTNFEILAIAEPRPKVEMKKADPKNYAIHSKIPVFIIFKLRKKGVAK